LQAGGKHTNKVHCEDVEQVIFSYTWNLCILFENLPVFKNTKHCFVFFA
jgi:hypothetical protein